MRKLIESTHVALGGQIDPLDWAFPYLDDEHMAYATGLLAEADALLLGRRTYVAGRRQALHQRSPGLDLHAQDAGPLSQAQ